jgi:hypothetical protein
VSVYVEVRLETGVKIGYMEIVRETDLEHPHHSMPPSQPGTYEYRFKYNGHWGRGVVGGSVLHERSKDVFELIRTVLNHSEQTNPEYCGGCHCQFVPVPGLGSEGETFYRKVETPQ